MVTEAFYLQYVPTVPWMAAFLCPLSLSWSTQCMPLLSSLCSVALLLPCAFLFHSGLSYIIHVKQTDLSESLKCMAVLSQLLPPWEGGHVSKAPVCSPGPAELKSATANINCTFYKEKNQCSSYTRVYLYKIFKLKPLSSHKVILVLRMELLCRIIANVGSGVCFKEIQQRSLLFVKVYSKETCSLLLRILPQLVKEFSLCACFCRCINTKLPTWVLWKPAQSIVWSIQM